jgi:glycosyltransferase involved in cell wall biosynthesis/tetratricopeptide (TPR) repeat protein
MHWPQGVYHKNNPRAAREFFSQARALLLCNTNGDDDGETQDLTVILSSGRNPVILRECLTRLKATANRDLKFEVILLIPPGDKKMFAAAYKLGQQILPLRIYERAQHQTPLQQMNAVADGSSASFLLFADEGVLLPPGWNGPLLHAIRSTADIGAVLPVVPPCFNAGGDSLSADVRCLLIRRTVFAEGLGFNEKLTSVGAAWNLLLHLHSLKYQVVRCPEVTVELSPDETTSDLSVSDRRLLLRCWPDFEQLAASIATRPDALADHSKTLTIDWVGSFLDHGSLSHVNREWTTALQSAPGIHLRRVSNGAPTSPGFENLAREIFATASSDAAVTVRHAWPPDWKRPRNGKLVVIQPWEFGSLPELWVQNSTQVDEFWVPSEYVRRVYVESGVPAGKVVVVPNGVNLEKFHPQAVPIKLTTQKKFKFLFVGGTIFRKGPDLLLKAYLKNFTAADDVCLVIKDFGGQTVYAGQTFESQIRAAQSQSNAPEILYLNSELPPDSLPGLYTACDCLVLPYRGEGFGLPVLEAMACGLPVIVTAGGATDDFVRDDFAWRIPSERRIFGHEISGLKLAGPGWLLEPDMAALGQFMRVAFTNPAEAHRRGPLAAQHARQFCSWQNSAAIAARRILDLASKPSEVGIQTVSSNPSAKSARLEKTPAAKVKITLPPCALVGHLAGARELVRQKKFQAAWAATLAVLAQRPFHPEASLLLAEIANDVGDGRAAKLCAEQARQIAPGWKPAKKFLNQRLKGGAQPDWLKLPDAIGNPKSGIQNRLSVCLIVKNEEKFLGQCLKSVRDLASQIVVVDTGSTDRTVAIAKEYGAEVYSFAWCDDFSAARNAALEHVTGDWVLVLDADEELSAEGREKLKSAMNCAAVMAWRLPLVNVGHEAEGRSFVPRLFRNAPGLFYVGRVHEQVFSSIEVRRAEWGLENRLGDATLIHYGYTAEMTRDRNKIERNLRLLERAVEELPDEPHLLMNLGLELARSGRETEARARYLEAFNSLSSKPAAEIVPELRETLLTQLCTRLTAVKRFDEVVSVLTSPLAEMNGGLTASLHFSLGLSHLELKQFREAADQMRQCLAKRSQPGLAPINQEINTAAPHHCLALCLVKSGDADAAEKAFQDGLGETGHDDALRLDYARFLAGQNRPVDALGRLNEVVAKNARHLGAWQLGGQIALSRPEFLEFARDWTKEAMLHVATDPLIIAQRAEALMLSEDTAGALELWQRVGDQTSPPAVLAAWILCETVELPTTQAPQEGQGEVAASRAFIAWYQKLVSVKACKTILRLNEQTDKLSRALPSAARMLEAALTEASRNGAQARV